jgi:hypothetical protein
MHQFGDDHHKHALTKCNNHLWTMASPDQHEAKLQIRMTLFQKMIKAKFWRINCFTMHGY